MKALFDHIDHRLPNYVDELADLVRIPSFRSNEEGMLAACDWLEAKLKAAGAEVERFDVPGAHPYLVGTVRGKSDRTVLFFNHYDIADYTNPVVLPPPDGQRHPFSGTVEDDKIYGRGIADDKATLLSRLHALQAYQEVHGPPPVTVKFLWEGKQEIHSPALGEFLRLYHDKVAADWCLWEAGSRDHLDRQIISLGHKGHVYVRLIAKVLNQASSPSRVTPLPNAAWRLVWALATLKDANDEVLIPGFRDGLRPYTDEEAALVDTIAGDPSGLLEEYGAPGFVRGLSGREAGRYMYDEPTLTLCGIEGGLAPADIVLTNPGTAVANLEFRLMPDQDPDRLLEQLRTHLDQNGFADIEIEVLSAVPPYRVDAAEPLAQLLHEIGSGVFPNGAVLAPVATGIAHRYLFRPYTSMPIVGFAIGYAGMQIETPEEHIRMSDYKQGIKFVAAILGRLGELADR